MKADTESFSTDVYVHKVRYKWFGKTGVANLTYDLSTGLYTSRMGDANVLEDVDWGKVRDGDDGWDDSDWKKSETEDPEPPEAEEMELEFEKEQEEISNEEKYDVPF